MFQTPQFLLGVNGYYESGSRGTWMIDPDPVRLNVFLDDEHKDFFWFGREQPLNLTRSEPVDPLSALGTVWSQDQMNALNPKTSGWIGAGLKADLSKDWTLLMAFSPIFLPNFSPSLGFSDYGNLNPARFARLPPATVNTGGVSLPIYYKLNVGDLSNIQYFTGISHDDTTVNMDAYFYSAPRPSAVPTTSAALAVTPTVVNAQVEIQPNFPREYWSGMRTQFKEIFFKPAVEFVQNWNDISLHYISLTGYLDLPKVNPYVVKNTTRLSFGLLTHLQKQFIDPQFSDLMLFAKLPIDLTNELCFRNILEATVLTGKQSYYWLGELEYTFTKSFSALAGLRLLNGSDGSYFGDWRTESSISAGIRYLW